MGHGQVEVLAEQPGEAPLSRSLCGVRVLPQRLLGVEQAVWGEHAEA